MLMYMIIFSTGASTFTYLLADMLPVSYGIWVGSFCVLGTICGEIFPVRGGEIFPVRGGKTKEDCSSAAISLSHVSL